MVTKLLSEDDARRVEEAIARVEQRSATELVVALVERCGDYWKPRVLIALCWGLAAALGLHVFAPQLSLLECLLAELLVGALVFAGLGVAPFNRWWLPAQEAEAAVQRRAFAVFAERGIHETSRRTGLLILLSELEHRVVVLGDSGLKRSVGDEAFRRYADELIRHVRAGRAVEGILEVIRQVEAVVVEVAPAELDNPNELPNAIVRER